MPRGKIRFSAQSPDGDDWFREPERVVAEIAEKHGARYIPDSLMFSHNGQTAEMLVETFEDRTDFYGLGEDLDAYTVTLFINPEIWLRRFGQPGDGTAQSGA